MSTAQALLEKAIAIDPNYGQAQALLAASHMFGVHLGWAELAKAAPIAERAALAAVQLDREDAWAHAALGSVYFSTRRLADALSEFETALRLNPNFCLAQGYYALALSYAGRHRGFLRGGAARHPSQPARSRRLRSITASPAMPASSTRQYDEAIALAREAIRHRGDLTGAYRVLVVSAGMSGDAATAEMALAELRRTQPNISLAWIATQLPWRNEADREHFLEGLPPRRDDLNRPPAGRRLMAGWRTAAGSIASWTGPGICSASRAASTAPNTGWRGWSSLSLMIVFVGLVYAALTINFVAHAMGTAHGKGKVSFGFDLDDIFLPARSGDLAGAVACQAADGADQGRRHGVVPLDLPRHLDQAAA